MAQTNDHKIAAELRSSSEFIKLGALFAAVTAWAAATGYYQSFSIFAAYDDEGYLMMTVKQFLEGSVLYDQIYTQYGPAYYIYKWIPHTLLNLPVTHNITRFSTLLVWTLTALISGLFVFRLTRSKLAAAAVYLFTFLALFRTVYEPGHPQELCGLLVVSILFLLSGDNHGRFFELRLALIGALTAFLCLTKVNIGFFVCLALAITFLAFTKTSKIQRLALIGLTCAAAILPFVLFRKYFDLGWLDLSVIVACGLIATLLTGLIRVDKTIFTFRHYLLISVSFLAASLLIISFVFLKGTTPQALINGVVLQHLRFSDNFFMAAPIQDLAIFWTIFALVTAAVLSYFSRKHIFETNIAIFIIKAGFGLCVITASLVGYYNFLGSFLLLNFAAPFLWLLLFKPFAKTGIQENQRETFLSGDMPRTALTIVSLLQPLQIFPIPGTQMSYATFTMIIIAVLCLYDAASKSKILFPEIFGSIYTRKALLIAASFALICTAVYRTSTNREIYNSQIPLNLTGANRIRLPEKDVETYNFLVKSIESNCDTFVSMPGINSLYFWSQKKPPTTFNATTWMTLLNDEQQQKTVERLKAERRVCAVYHPQLTQNGLREGKLADFPLSRFIENKFTVRGEINQYRFMTLNESAVNPALPSSDSGK